MPPRPRTDVELGAAIVVGAARREVDRAALALGGELARVTGAPLALVHAYPFQPLIAVPPPAWEPEMRAEVLAALEALAAPLREIAPVTVHARPSRPPCARCTRRPTSSERR
jgi:nucleotide-binding universal stress UspA family protein